MDALLPLTTWTLYAGGLYLLWSVGFRVRYGRWPMAYSMPPRDAYTWIDMGLSAAMWGYFAWCVALAWPIISQWTRSGAPAAPIRPGVWMGLAVVSLGAALRIWTLITLGPNWRMGQDERDTAHAFVATGPYRVMKHPINTATAIVALGQVGLTQGSWAAWCLLGVALAYHKAQGAAEVAFWNARNRK